MTKQQITLAKALDLVDFHFAGGEWMVKDVKGDVWGNVRGSLFGSVFGDAWGNIVGRVFGTINGKDWDYVETPKQKLRRLIKEQESAIGTVAVEELLEAFNQAMHPTTQEDS